MTTAPFVPPDFDTEEPWQNCGPVALASMIGRSMAETRPLLGSFKGFMNARDMLAALEAAGRPGKLHTQAQPTWRGVGLVRVQFEGPWLQPGVPPAAAFRYTHWIASRGPALVLGVNFDPLRWDTWAKWERTVAPALVESTPRATGWRIRDVIVPQRAARSGR